MAYIYNAHVLRYCIDALQNKLISLPHPIPHIVINANSYALINCDARHITIISILNTIYLK